MEPYLFNSRYFSIKVCSDGVRSVFKMSIKTSYILCVNNPFPCGTDADIGTD